MEILQGLNDRQLEAVTTTEGPVLVIAGAGSGKTRVLTQRIAYIIQEKKVKPWNILAITFTNKAANEMKERIEAVVGECAKDIWSGTFHGICVRILRKNIERIGYTSNFNIYDMTDTKTIIKDCIRELQLDDKIFRDKSIQSQISNLKSDMISEEEYAIRAGSDYRESKIAKIYELYQKKLQQNNGLDFDDIILKTIKVLLENPDVLSYYQQKFQYILVDEYQDTNKPQFTLVNLLAGMYGNLFVVGDNDQSIYAFRGADISNILNFERDYPGAKIIKLEQNYRSTQQILDIANDVIKNNEAKIVKKLWTNKNDGKKPVYAKVYNQNAEAMYIANVVTEGVREGRKYNDFAILYRTNAQSRSIEEEFFKDGIPYRVIGGMKFYDRKEIKDIVAYLRIIENPVDSVSLKRVINEPKRGIGDTSINNIEKIANENGITMFDVLKKADEFGLRGFDVLKDFAQMIIDFNEVKDSVDLDELINRVLDVTGYIKMLESDDSVESKSRIENIQELITTAHEFNEESADNTLSQFLENVSLVSDIDNLDETEDYVVMMTMHNAKGLEFPVVFACGMEEGIFPSYQSMDEENGIEEERRLCYVAITRAKEELHLISANIRTIYGSTTCNMCSRFVKEINPELIEIIGEKKKDVDEEVDLPKQKNTMNVFRSAENFLNSLNKEPNKEIDITQYKEGQTVSHKKFGIGVIKKLEPEEEDIKVEIEFEKFGTKRLMAKYAGLEIIN